MDQPVDGSPLARSSEGQPEEYPLLGPLRDALAASGTWWTNVFETADIGMVVASTDGELLGITPALARMLGYTRAEVMRRGVQGISHPDDLELDLELFQQLVDGEADQYQLDKRYLRADGSIMWGRLTVMVVPAPDGGGSWLVGMLQDITERKHEEQRLRRFIAEASHELRTPVAVIRGVAELVTSADADDEARPRLLEALQVHAGRLADLLDRLLDLSVLEQRRQLAVAPVDLARSVQEALAGSVSASEDEAICVDVPAGLEVVADAVALRQVVSNLVRNAQAHGRPPIVVRAREAHHSVVVEVRDHGQGLSEGTLDQLFQPFASAAEGMGLGLAITRATVEAMGGMVWYEDAQPGASFKVRLPIAGSRT